MRKQVTFLEESKHREYMQHGNSRFIATRSAGSPRASRVLLNVDENSYLNTRPRKALQYKPLPQRAVENQHLKTIHIPKSMMMAPFLQHPSLTAGQKRYLCSIASVYSTEHQRRQMRQHYLHALRSCTGTAAGHRSAGKHRGIVLRGCPKGHPTSSAHSGDYPPSHARTSTHREPHSGTASSDKLVLPQITRQNRNPSHTSAQNVVSHRKVKNSGAQIALCASSKGDGAKAFTPHQREDLEENMSSLSLEEEMDIVLN